MDAQSNQMEIDGRLEAEETEFLDQSGKASVGGHTLSGQGSFLREIRAQGVKFQAKIPSGTPSGKPEG